MFGLLRPTDRGLRCFERQEFNTFYCGLCKGLDHHHGAVTRGLLSYDGVFVALVVDALVTEAAPPSKCRCPVLPVVQRKTVAPDSVAMTYAASVQMLLFDQWAADGGRSLVRRFSRPHAEAAHARLEALGVSLRMLSEFDRVQSRVESDEAGPIRAAAPTAEALRLVFSRIASLPGAADGGERLATTLGELGAAVGRAIYFVDALEDLDDDIRKGAFNPCIMHGRRDERRVRETTRLLRGNVDGLRPLLDALPLLRHERVLRDILAQLTTRAMTAIAQDGARRASESKLRAVLVAMAMFLWAMLCTVPRAFAAPKRDAGKHPDAGLHDAGPDASSESPWGPLVMPSEDSGLPALPPPAPSEEEEKATAEKEKESGKEKEKAKEKGRGKDDDKPAACPDCGKTFTDCKECCRAPGHCFDSCGSCCNGCGDCCKGCDNCGKSCGDCGNCCNNCGSCCK